LVQFRENHCFDLAVRSGAGKSTLLNVLNQRNLKRMTVDGSLRVNGALAGDGSAVASLSGYVQQDDAFVGMLTVREHLWFQAMLRMDRQLSDDERNVKIDEVIREVRPAGRPPPPPRELLSRRIDVKTLENKKN